MEQMRVGVWFYGSATVVTGILDIVWGKFEASHQPVQSFAPHLPGQQVLAYIAGVWLVAAGVAILWRRTARIGAAGSAIFAEFVASRRQSDQNKNGVAGPGSTSHPDSMDIDKITTRRKMA
jgi:uncharacterized membrane protein YphA (DoxX/SURF4 family)